MEFYNFNKLFEKNFEKLTKDSPVLFEVQVDKDELWNLYLDSFPAGYNEIYRKRREHDCSCCRHFVKTLGNLIVIKNNKIHTMWGFEANTPAFQVVIDVMNQYLMAKCRAKKRTVCICPKFNRIRVLKMLHEFPFFQTRNFESNVGRTNSFKSV